MENVIELKSPLLELGECPLWVESEKKLYWVNILGGELYSYSFKLKQSELVLKIDTTIGGIELFDNKSLLLACGNGIFRFRFDTRGYEKLSEPFLTENERFNDILLDSRGRLLAGTLESTFKQGRLISFKMGEQPTVLLRGISVSNGMVLSKDEKTLYHTDSFKRKITSYNYDIETGKITKPVLFYQGVEDDGYPDGLTQDREGNLWSACWGASQVIKINIRGEVIKRITLPASQVSSVAFGGEKRTTLFVTSAWQGGEDSKAGLDSGGKLLGGRLYCVEEI